MRCVSFRVAGVPSLLKLALKVLGSVVATYLHSIEEVSLESHEHGILQLGIVWRGYLLREEVFCIMEADCGRYERLFSQKISLSNYYNLASFSFSLQFPFLFYFWVKNQKDCWVIFPGKKMWFSLVFLAWLNNGCLLKKKKFLNGRLWVAWEWFSGRWPRRFEEEKMVFAEFL